MCSFPSWTSDERCPDETHHSGRQDYLEPPWRRMTSQRALNGTREVENHTGKRQASARDVGDRSTHSAAWRALQGPVSCIPPSLHTPLVARRRPRQIHLNLTTLSLHPAGISPIPRSGTRGKGPLPAWPSRLAPADQSLRRDDGESKGSGHTARMARLPLAAAVAAFSGADGATNGLPSPD